MKPRLLTQVLKAIRTDLRELSTVRPNSYGIVIELVRKEPRHVPEPWNAQFHVQLNNLTCASVTLIELSWRKVVVELQCYRIDFKRGMSFGTGKPFTITVEQRGRGEENIRSEVDKLTLKLSTHIRAHTGLPKFSESFGQVWKVCVQANSLKTVIAALSCLQQDLAKHPEAVICNGAHRLYLLTARGKLAKA